MAVADSDSDAGLLERFVRGRDEDAFAALVARHGPMVLGVCRRLVGDSHAAEDAFQAVFVVLARKAAQNCGLFRGRRQVPLSNREVRSAGEDATAVGGGGQRQHGAGVAATGNFLAGVHVP